MLRRCLITMAACAAVLSASAANAEKKYDPGASDTEIRIGNIMPYSGPASSYAVIGKTEAAYFDKVNAEGGINGRKINFITYDDGYSPPKAIEQARKLVEGDEVLLVFQSNNCGKSRKPEPGWQAAACSTFAARRTRRWPIPSIVPDGGSCEPWIDQTTFGRDTISIIFPSSSSGAASFARWYASTAARPITGVALSNCSASATA